MTTTTKKEEDEKRWNSSCKDMYARVKHTKRVGSIKVVFGKTYYRQINLLAKENARV